MVSTPTTAGFGFGVPAIESDKSLKFPVALLLQALVFACALAVDECMLTMIVDSMSPSASANNWRLRTMCSPDFEFCGSDVACPPQTGIKGLHQGASFKAQTPETVKN